MTLLLADSDLRNRYTMKACIEAVERAFAAAGRGRLELVPRRVVAAGKGARIHTLSAASDELGYLFSLTYTGTPKGDDKNRTPVKRRQKVSAVFDASTGACEAIIGGRYLSWLNTGAMGAVAIKHLSAPDARSMAIIGSGRQARAALVGALEVRQLEDIRVWSRQQENAARLVEEFDHVPGMRAVSTVHEAVRAAEIVVTVTTSATPVVQGDWLEPGSHLNTIGAHYPESREVDTAAIVDSTVFVDTMATASVEKGELLIPQAEGAFDLGKVHAELGELVAGTADWSRGEKERTSFASCGSAVEAFGAAVGALEWARSGSWKQFDFG